jgi:pimeloyl-ACP methyl ester carboxylesterase
MPQFEMIEVRPGIRVATEVRRPKGVRHPHPGFMWLNGFKSDMAGIKATRLRDLAWQGGRPFIRFDYSGHGLSGGRFEDGTISHWLEEAQMVLALAEDWPMILIGSSMGAYLATLLARRKVSSIKGLVLVAPAADMTQALMEPQIASNGEAQAALARDGVWLRPSRYGEPYPITHKLIEDGRKHLILHDGVDVDCPVRILHGDQDPDVPWEHGLAIFRAIRSADIQFTLIKGGDHRLSRDSDIRAIHSAAEHLAVDAAVNAEPPEKGSDSEAP